MYANIGSPITKSASALEKPPNTVNRLSTRSPFLLLASRTGSRNWRVLYWKKGGERCYVAFLRLLLVLFLRVLFLVAGFFGSGAGAGAFVVSGLGFGEGFGGGDDG